MLIRVDLTVPDDSAPALAATNAAVADLLTAVLRLGGVRAAGADVRARWRDAAVGEDGRLRCPHCGNDDPDEMRAVEDGPYYRDVLESGDGFVVLEGRYEAGDAEDVVRILCLDPECSRDFVLPDGFDLDYET